MGWRGRDREKHKQREKKMLLESEREEDGQTDQESRAYESELTSHSLGNGACCLELTFM